MTSPLASGALVALGVVAYVVITGVVLQSVLGVDSGDLPLAVAIAAAAGGRLLARVTRRFEAR